MPTITVNRKVVEDIIGKKLSEQELKKKITYLGTDLEAIDQDEITLEIFPNRPDMLSEQGFGRALSSFIGNKTGLRKYTAKKSGEKCIVGKEMKDIRPYTACCIVKNLDLDHEKITEIIQIQEKLHITFCRKRKKAAMGIYPCEKIKFPIYLKADKPENIVFRPLEYPKELNARKILSKHPTGREYAYLVEGLDRYAYFVDDNDQILSFTPIINSHLTGKINEDTKEVFIEVSGFDLNICKMVLNILVTALADMGAEIYSMEVKYPDNTITTPGLKPMEIKADPDYINKKLGLNLSKKQLKELLEKMGYGYKKGKALVPCYRPDVIHPIDLVEDAAIAYGYDNFKPEIPTKATIGKEDDFEIFKNKVARILVGLNLLETSTYHITSKEIQTEMMEFDYEIVELANALTKDFNVLRFWMIPSLLQVLKENKHNEYPQEIFDIGTVFKKNKDTETGIQEDCRLSLALCSKDADYTKARQILDYLIKSIGLEIKVKETEHPSFIPGRVGRGVIGEKEVAYVGEIHPKVLENFELEFPVSVFELNLTEIFKIMGRKEEKYTEKTGLLFEKEIIEKYPFLLIKKKKIEDVKIEDKDPSQEKRKQELISKWKKKKKIDSKEFEEYKKFHERIGLDDVTSAAEAIIRRYLAKGEFPDINSAVDAGNIVSVEKMRSIGLFDLDKIKGKIKIRFAEKGDRYHPYGQKSEVRIKPGKIIMEDEEKIFGVLGYKDSIMTSVDEDTKNLLVIAWGEKGKDEDIIRDVFEEVE
ncbi:phenylalanine--tRNA ligase subunit beta, partial [Candidatus Woesearchaeota archaeon]|nr:phenylalanine--tRNA ligase subunit beta [Candidatus Woesearchaeota archaeon]